MQASVNFDMKLIMISLCQNRTESVGAPGLFFHKVFAQKDLNDNYNLPI